MINKNLVFLLVVAIIAEVLAVIAIYHGFKFARELEDNMELVIGFGSALLCNMIIVLAYLGLVNNQQSDED